MERLDHMTENQYMKQIQEINLEETLTMNYLKHTF